MSYSSKDDSHLPNDCVFHIIIGLVGIFVSFFLCFMLLHMYIQCFFGELKKNSAVAKIFKFDTDPSIWKQ